MAKILWIDDEIDLLKPHIIFLEQKGYKVETINNGNDALDMVNDNNYDLIFLDENMPGLSGIDTLEKIKLKHNHLPIIMITKSEEESIMESAIGKSIADYLIKPVNPNQILMAVKKNLAEHQIIEEQTTKSYRQEFQKLAQKISNKLNFEEWKSVYNELIHWEIRVSKLQDSSMKEIFEMQKKEANLLFSRYYIDNYKSWFGSNNAPTMSHNLIRKEILPRMSNAKNNFILVIDNLRLDQWKEIFAKINHLFFIESEDTYFSILPTATQYARNSLFAGMMPMAIKNKYPDKWIEEIDEESKNNYEDFFAQELMSKYASEKKVKYTKIHKLDFAKKVVDKFDELLNYDVNFIVYNFVDMLSHARTDMEVIKELAENEAAYRSLTLSWFEHSPLKKIIEKIAKSNSKLFITTDHGTIKVENPIKIQGDKNVNTNLRYKIGKTLSYNKNEVFEITNPSEIHLPQVSNNDKYIFATNDDYFVYQNNFNNFVNLYKNTFQHGGISMEEVIIPIVSLEPK